MVEVTNPSPMFYGVGGAPIASQDGATIRLDAGGAIQISSSVTEQGQGTNTILAQIAADVFGVDMARVRVTTGDTEVRRRTAAAPGPRAGPGSVARRCCKRPLL